MNLKLTAGHVLLLCSLIFCCTSCFKKLPEGMPDLYSSSVVLTQEGAPLEGATIIAVPLEGSKNWSVAGTTDANGLAVLSTNGKYKGAPAGNYVLLITKNTVETQELPSKPGQTEKLFGSTKFYSQVESVYADKEKSPAKITVEKKKNEFKLDAGKKVKIAQKNNT